MQHSWRLKAQSLALELSFKVKNKNFFGSNQIFSNIKFA